VVGGGAAAAADDADGEPLDHLAELLGHGVGLEREDGEAADVNWDAGVRDDADGPSAVLAEVAGWLAHVLGAGRAVEADDVDGELLDDREGGGDVGPEEHPTGGVEGDRCLERDGPATLLADAEGGDDCRLELQDVLDGLHDEDITAAVDEASDLVEELLDDLLEPVLAEHRVLGGGQEAGGADRAGHEAGLGDGGVGVGDAAGELGGGAVELVGAVAEAVLLELDEGAAEGVGLENVRAGLEEVGVDVFDDGGVDEDEVLVAALLAAVVLGGELSVEDGRAHGAVVDDDALADGIEEWAGHGALPARDEGNRDQGSGAAGGRSPDSRSLTPPL
jgi:hypothetical protein